MDFVFPTTNVGNTGYGDNKQLGITGTESVLQIVREILVGFNWEEDALGRSKQSYRTAHESLGKSLEGKSTEMIMDAVASGDKRYVYSTFVQLLDYFRRTQMSFFLHFHNAFVAVLDSYLLM